MNNIVRLIYLSMSQSRVCELLKRSRSRHEIIVDRELKRASIDYQLQRKKSRQANEELRKMMSQMKYFQSLNTRLEKGVSYKKKQLNQVMSIRERFTNDLKRKEKIEQLKQKQIKKNKDLASKIKQQRNNRINSVKRSIFEKETLADQSRSEKERLRQERETLYHHQFAKNRNRVETIVQFQCNLRESFIKKKESDNNHFLKFYRKAIQQNKRTIEYKRTQTQNVKQRLKTLTEGTARRMAELSQLSNSIRRYKPTTQSRSPLSFNRKKLMQKSRCYTDTNSEYDKPTTQQNSLLMSQKRHTVNL